MGQGWFGVSYILPRDKSEPSCVSSCWSDRLKSSEFSRTLRVRGEELQWPIGEGGRLLTELRWGAAASALVQPQAAPCM